MSKPLILNNKLGWSPEINGSILCFVPQKEAISVTIKSHQTLPKDMLLHYPFYFTQPDELYAYELSEIKLLLMNPHIDVNMILMYLCKRGEESLVKFMLNNLKHSSRIDLDKYSNYLLSVAVRYGHESTLKLFLACNRINLKNITLEMKSMFISKQYDMIKIILLDVRVDLSANANLIFRLAAKYGSKKIVELLLAEGRTTSTERAEGRTTSTERAEGRTTSNNTKYIDPTANNNEAIISACGYGHRDIVNILLSIIPPVGTDGRARPPIDPTVENNIAFIKAATYNHLNIVKILLNPPNNHQAANPSAQHNKAIRIASKLGHHQIVSYLLSLDEGYGINPTECNNESFRIAVTRNHHQTVKELLRDPRIDPNVNSGMMIKLAIKHQYIEIVKYLKLDSRVDTSNFIDQKICTS